MIRSLITKKFPASRLALSIGLGGSLFALNFASAQQVSNPTTSQAPETAAADRVIITGSNIPSSEEVGAAPVDTVDQAARDRTGQEDVLTVLTASTPAISSGGGNLGQSNASVASGSTLGGSTVAIHGLPVLVLLNGRRLTDASAAAAGGAAFTDLNLFPSRLVKRIEVLKDGASAIYGTEAVGGVINVILNQEFQGFEFSARYGDTERARVEDQSYSVIFGLGDAKTHIVVGAEYVEQDPIFNRDRDFSQPTFASTTYAGIVRINGQRYSLGAAFGSPADVNPANPGAGTVLNTTPLTNGTYNKVNVSQTLAGFDTSRVTTITLDQTRLSVFSSADRELYGKNVVAFADFLYTSNFSQSQLNGQPLSNAQQFGGQNLSIPAAAPFNPFGVKADGTTTGTFLANNRFVSNPRVFRQDTDFYRVVAGLKGEIIPNYNYEVALNSSRDETSFKNFNLINGPNLESAVTGGFTATGASQLAGVNGATVNGPYSMVNGNLQPALDYFSRRPSSASLVGVFGTDIRYFETKFAGVDGKITAFPVNLPAGPLGIAAGGEYRHESLKANVDPQNIFVGSVPIGNIDVGRDVTAGFVEVQIPIIGPDMHIPGVYSFDLDGAGRFEDYNPGNSTWVPKVGFVYRPIKDIALRGTFSKSFIAPTLYQTNGPSSSGFTAGVTLSAATGQEQAQSTSGSNPGLGNERADTYTAGIVISPHQVPGLTLNADFFHVEEFNLIGNISTTTILQSVNQLGAASPFAGLVHFNNFTGPGVTAPLQLQGNLPITYLTDPLQNLGGARLGGIDFGAHYNHDFGKFGAMNIGIDGTYYLQYKVQSFKFTPFYNIIGFYNGQASEVADYHLTPTVEYKFQGFTASALGNYTPSVRDASNVSLDPTQGGIDQNKQRYTLNKIRDYYTIDLLLAYEFGLNKPTDESAPAPAPKDAKDGGKEVVSHQEAKKMMSFHLLDGLKLSFGITNVTNARPPAIGSPLSSSPDSTNTDAAIYDPYQRRYYFIVTKKF